MEVGRKPGSNFKSCRSNVNDDCEDDSHLRKRLKSFVASKADLIFKLKGKEKWRSGIDYKADSSLEAYKRFATQIPALETEMQISATVRRTCMFQILEVGDIIVGNVVAKRPFGVFVKIVSLMHGRNLDFNEIDIQAMCHKSELDHKSREHLDPIDDFEINDIVQGVICSVSVEEEKIAISFRSSKLPSEYGNIELGIIEDADEHIHRMQYFDEDKDYNDYLHKDPGFANPTNVQTLINVLGINTNPPCSLLRSCERWSSNGQEDAISLRKKQSLKWSMDTTAIGVDNFKCGSHEKAMKCFNHALQIYEENAEALVARGALYANQNKLDNAIKDFREALKCHPKHHNAYKYLKETLLEKAVRIKKMGIIKEGIDIFQEILSLDPHHTESQDHLRELQSLMSLKCEEERRKDRKASEGGSAKESGQFEHVRKLIKADPDIARTSHKKKRRKKKKHKDNREKRSRQRKVSDESTSTASEGGDYCESDDTGDCKWAEKKVEKKLGAKSPKEIYKEQGGKDHGQHPDDREMKSQSNSRGKVKEERKGQNETKTRSDLKRNLSHESHGSQGSHCKSPMRRHLEIQSGTLTRSRSRSRTRRSRENSRSTSRGNSRSRSRDRRARRSTKGSRRASRSTSRDTRAHRSTSRGNSRSRSRDRRACRSIKGSRRASRSTSRDTRARRSTSRGNSRSRSRDRRARRSTKGSRRASRSTSRDTRARRSTSRGNSRSRSRDRRACRSIKGSRRASRSTSRDTRARRSTSRGNSRSRSRDRRACRSIKGSRRASRSTSRDTKACRSTKGSRQTSRSTSRDRKACRRTSSSS